MMNLVIVAGGLGSRLAPVTNFIPKFLVNIGKQTGYVEQIRYWEQYDLDSITVIVHPAYEKLVMAYHKVYFPEVSLRVKTVDVANGSAHAILTSCRHLEGLPVMFSWCDVLPVDRIPADDSDLSQLYNGANVIFTNYNNSNRYGLKKAGHGWADVRPVLDPNEAGGCFGLYYISQYHSNISTRDGQDFIDVIEQYGKIREHRIEHIIDFGDMPKLIRTRAKADEAREFNSIEYIGDFVLKKATNDQGRIIIEKEIGWYESLAKLHEISESPRALPVPSIWASPSKDSFFMTKAKGVSIWKAWPDLSAADRHYVLSQFISAREHMFELGREKFPLHSVLTDIRAEAGDKLIKRYSEIHEVIDAFGPIRCVNGYPLKESNPVLTIVRLSTAIEEYYKNSLPDYGFIHGDLQFSNSMVDIETRQVTIIDPRGYFGRTEGLGLEDYDIGKLLYALTGYDTFNYSKTFGIKQLGDGHIMFDIEQPSHEGIEDIVAEHFKPIHQLWLAVCWIGLAGYIKNDPVKSVASHYHGLAMAEKALDRLS